MEEGFSLVHAVADKKNIFLAKGIRTFEKLKRYFQNFGKTLPLASTWVPPWPVDVKKSVNHVNLFDILLSFFARLVCIHLK